MYELFDLPKGKKEHKWYDVGHWVPKEDVFRETTAWLDEHLGPAQRVADGN